MSHGRSSLLAPRLRQLRAVAGGASVALLLAGCGLLGGDDNSGEITAAGTAFLEDWAAGRYPEAAARTTDPAKAEQILKSVSDTLRLSSRTLRPGALTGCKNDEPCQLGFEATLSLATLGDWTYAGALTLTQVAEAWQVEWSPAVVHPKLTADTALARVRELPPRAPILDRENRPLVTDQEVVRVGITAGKTLEESIRKLAQVLDLNYETLAQRSKNTPTSQFVEAVVLRKSEHDAVKLQLDDIPGVLERPDTLPLAPTRQYARALLGAVTPATKETLEKAGPMASSADEVGSFGLQAKFQQQLAGLPGGRVNLIRTPDRTVVETLHEFVAKPGSPVQLTLDKRVQDAAESALASVPNGASLVAIDTETGDVLAVANGPADRSAEDRALSGRYPPGSTFKVVTTTALLRDGLKTTDTVACPATVNVGGKRFENYDGLGALGNVPFRKDFTESCNTAFITRAGKLGPDALTQAAASFGLTSGWDLGVPSFAGSVPTSTSPIDQGAAAIGQGRVLMSPLAMASVAATVASGTPRTPRLLMDEAPSETGESLPEAETLRELMLATVREGTANVLQIAGEEIGAKTGTAEYGSGDQAGLHAWMIGFTGRIAFAVIVEDGVSGSKTAGPVARRFLLAVRGLD